MRMRYQLQPLTREQRVIIEYLLLDEMDRQQWFSIEFLQLWQTEGYICIQ